MSTDDELVDLLASVLDEAPSEPPADRVAALRARAEAARASINADAPRPGSRWLLAAAAAVVGIVAGFAVVRAFEDSPAGPAASGEIEYDGTLAGPDGQPADAHLRVVKTGIGRVIELDTDQLPILPEGEYYEVSFVAPAEGGGKPKRISAGTFHPDPDGRSFVRFAAAVDPAKFPTVEVTAEPGDGNPAPTGPVVLRATIDS